MRKMTAIEKSRMEETIKVVQTATTVEEVEAALLKCRRNEMGWVFCKVLHTPFVCWDSEKTDAEVANKLATRVIKKKEKKMTEMTKAETHVAFADRRDDEP